MAIVDLDREQQIELLDAGLERLVEVYLPLAVSVVSRYAQGGDVERLAEDVLLRSLERAVAPYLERLPEYRFDTYLTYYLVREIEERLGGEE